RYCEIFERLEELILDHMAHHDNGIREMSRLSQLCPTVGNFFTQLPLREAFLVQNAKRSIAGRRQVPPSFNDVRWILNTAQVNAIAPTLQLITFDGDMTLYSDGASFAQDSHLLQVLLSLLRNDVTVAIVTAAGYGTDGPKYEARLSGLLDAFRGGECGLSKEQLARFYVFGGECNYLFQYDPSTRHLRYIVPEMYETPAVASWSRNQPRIQWLLDAAQSCIEEVTREAGLVGRVQIIRKERAVGLVPAAAVQLTREQLDEYALSVQQRVRNAQHAAATSRRSQTDLFSPTDGVEGSTPLLPFCAFNGGTDVWVDVGSKMIAVELLQRFLGAKPAATLHVGDQFLSTGNDFATRAACTTVWITSPEETGEVLNELIPQLEQNRPGNTE
ncbi:IMP-specific 5-nucleotidase, partial [Cladochytrium replicatum]